MGNVGCALLHYLAGIQNIDQVFVISRKEKTALAAILDVASASPQGAAKMNFANYESLSHADVVVLTAGVQMKAGQTGKSVLKDNLEITDTILNSCSLKPSAILICLATPVDYITAYVQKKTRLPLKQVFGFGGDLDQNRLKYILRDKSKIAKQASIVGEHGANAIPIYEGEADYDRVASELRRFLAKITAYAGDTKNLATGKLLGLLIQSIVSAKKDTHYLCGYHEELGLYLTWPFSVGRSGIIHSLEVSLQTRAQSDLDKLIAGRKSGLGELFIE